MSITAWFLVVAYAVYVIFVTTFVSISPVVRIYMSMDTYAHIVLNSIVLVLGAVLITMSIACMEDGGCSTLAIINVMILTLLLTFQVAAMIYVFYNYHLNAGHGNQMIDYDDQDHAPAPNHAPAPAPNHAPAPAPNPAPTPAPNHAPAPAPNHALAPAPNHAPTAPLNPVPSTDHASPALATVTSTGNVSPSPSSAIANVLTSSPFVRFPGQNDEEEEEDLLIIQKKSRKNNKHVSNEEYEFSDDEYDSWTYEQSPDLAPLVRYAKPHRHHRRVLDPPSITSIATIM